MLECGCPENYPEDWSGRDVDLGGQFIHRIRIPTPIHMPLAFEAYLQRQQRSLLELGLPERWPGLALVETGLWRGSLTRLLDVDEGPPSHLVSYLPRPYPVRALVHDGDVGTLRPSLRRLQQGLLDEGRMPRTLYLCHLTCPRCRDDRGGDRILLLRHWRESETLAGRLARRRDSDTRR